MSATGGHANHGATSARRTLADTYSMTTFGQCLFNVSTMLATGCYVNLGATSAQAKLYYAFSNNRDVIPPKEVLPNSIFVFDDVACDNQNTIREYFSMGRHINIDCFYLCQTYAKIPKHLIRDNANLLILFKQDGTNLKHIYNDHVNTDMSYESWQLKYGFVVIDKDSTLHNGRYRRRFDDFAVV
ncbi:hypothetical protein ALC57_05405 [Trachymyrmex cornetzi]|uniref:Uncharacterized protein n=1 Tax=Trachymyrmex cornetzi TaxID=471704 RepID=A0A151JAR3_9HYME|nr:hypothetical protein ALC57_05405 [Trachymyrmex cornetzi]